MKIYKVSIQRLKQIIDAYQESKNYPHYMRTYKIAKKEIYIEVGEKNEI